MGDRRNLFSSFDDAHFMGTVRMANALEAINLIASDIGLRKGSILVVSAPVCLRILLQFCFM